MKKTAAVAAAIVVLALVAGAVWYLKGTPKTYSGTPEPIVLGGLVSDANTMLFVGEDRRFFAKNGVDFTLKTYDTGLETIDDLVSGKIDIAGAAEYPIVAKAFDKADIGIIASIAKSHLVHFVGLTDRGIREVADIKGKRIGLPRATILEFYLGRFLNLNGMGIQDVTLINMPQAQTTDALLRGSVDAVVTREPYASQIRKQRTSGIVSWPVQSSQPVFSILMCRNDWIKQHPDLVRRFLNALVQAEGYIEQHPAGAKAILRKRYRYDDEYVARIWPEHQFSLSLDQSFIAALEDEARWMMGNNLTRGTQVPDFSDYIYADGLKAVKPEAVKIIR